MSGIFDVAVIGGGPAGASASIAAAQLGLKTVQLEAGRFPRHKVCGEFISGEALSVLSRLIGHSELLASAPRISQSRFFLDGRVIAIPINPAAASITRVDLDLLLWNAASRSGVATRDGSRVKNVHNLDLGFAIELEDERLLTKTVVNASGRWSNLTDGKPEGAENWIGLKGHFRENAGATSCDLYFFEGGYCGVQPLGGDLLNVAAMVRASVARSLAASFLLNGDLRARAGAWEAITEPISTAPLFFRLPLTQQRGMAMVGDAAAFIDPFSGDGISMALHSGWLAVDALSQYLRGGCSLRRALQDYDDSYRKLLRPALRNAARLRRLMQLPKALRATAISLFQLPPLARCAVRGTRARWPRLATAPLHSRAE